MPGALRRLLGVVGAWLSIAASLCPLRYGQSRGCGFCQGLDVVRRLARHREHEAVGGGLPDLVQEVASVQGKKEP